MKYKKTILVTGLAALAIVYGIWKASPVISKSLESEGFKLVTSAKNKEEIYKRILARYEEDINRDIKLDQFLVGENKKWVALSFWCDVQTNQKKFLVSLDNFKKYCVMSVADYLKDGYLKGKNNEDVMYVDYAEFSSKFETYSKLFKEKNLKWESTLLLNYKAWINWCKTIPYKGFDTKNKNTVRYFCFNYGEKIVGLSDGIKETK